MKIERWIDGRRKADGATERALGAAARDGDGAAANSVNDVDGPIERYKNNIRLNENTPFDKRKFAVVSMRPLSSPLFVFFEYDKGLTAIC